ncbi:MAG: carboxylating nicotinate-nucleotide diphosphorylase [Candidatus Thorarchaeota archaeon]|jgi:nicotinate-nucleotide pyrophosphorylase (carboxylating)
MNKLPPEVIESLKAFLKEDVRSGDITTNAMKPLDADATGTINSKGKSILAGLTEAAAIADFSGLEYEFLAFEGNWVDVREPVFRMTGSAKTLLVIERLCLNIIQRMSGIATMTYNMVQTARKENPNVRVAATRKTTPGFRFFEKRAVQIGGGDSHRYALDDMVLIKNNHIDVVGGVAEAVRMAKDAVSFSKKVSCEARSIEEGMDAVKAGADIILLDNFPPPDIEKFVSVLKEQDLRGKVLLETSGGIDEDNIAEYAATGIDIISSGALTHSYIAADYNMTIKLK